MTPAEFLDNIVTPNVAQLGENRGDMRCAVNALLTLDAFAGILFAHLKGLGRSHWVDDSKFRDFIADESPNFRIVRDAPFALEHGELTGKKPDLWRERTIASYSGVFDEAVFD